MLWRCTAPSPRTRTARLWNRIQARWRRQDGYQPFGYDFPTIRITKPGWVPVLEDIASAHNSLPRPSHLALLHENHL